MRQGLGTAVLKDDKANLSSVVKIEQGVYVNEGGRSFRKRKW